MLKDWRCSKEKYSNSWSFTFANPI